MFWDSSELRQVVPHFTGLQRDVAVRILGDNPLSLLRQNHPHVFLYESVEGLPGDEPAIKIQ